MRIGLAGVGRIGAFHAETLRDSYDVDEVVVGRPPRRGRPRAWRTSSRSASPPRRPSCWRPGVDGFVIATATPGHAPLLRLGLEAGVPTFCEKPVAATLDETLDLAELVARRPRPVHVGFQRRFDRGYQRARQAVAGGELGFVHTIRAQTHDQAPPHAAYIPTSGGLFRDCSIHDFDIVRFVTGHEVASVFASGANKGASFFSEAGDVDTAAAILTLDDGTLVIGDGHPLQRRRPRCPDGGLRQRRHHRRRLRPVAGRHLGRGGCDLPAGPRHWSFMERFLPAYRAELTAFADVARGARASPCTVVDALQAFRIAEACELSRHEGRVGPPRRDPGL